MRPYALLPFALSIVPAFLPACSGDGGSGPASSVTAIYDPSAGRDDFFSLPWPADSRVLVGADGKKHLDLTGFHDPGSAIGGYLDAFEKDEFTGFGTSSGIFFRFAAPLDPASLPQVSADSVADGASVFVVDVTAGSPTYGQRSPVRARFRHDAGLYIGTDWLALLPEPGFPLREKTTYAAVVTDAVKAAGGGSLKPDPRFVMPTMPMPPAVDPSHVVVMTVFTTADVTHLMRDLRAAIYSELPDPPVAADFTWVGTDSFKRYEQYEGTYAAPNFQEGDVPYLKAGGRIHLGADGKPAYTRMEQLRFAVTVPRGTMPDAGWPVVLYAHGTGGDYTSFIDDHSGGAASKVQADDGSVIAQMAMISIDQVLHGPRDPTMSDPDITFFNFQNLESARDSIKQGAADDFSLIRLVENMGIDAAPVTKAPVKFDKTRIYFKGHSQGGTTGPLFLAFEPEVKAAVLSGAGAGLILALTHKTEPVDIPAAVQGIVGEDIDEFHPLLSLLQNYLESSDPGNYARYFFREPPNGQAPKSIYQSLGIVDHYTPIPTIMALGLAMGVQPALPQQMAIDALPIEGLQWAPPPLQLNVAGGKASGVLAEYVVPVRSSGTEAYDGHFVVFDHPDAIRQSNRFLATHAATGVATLTP